MEMRAIHDTDIGQDLTPPLRPLAFSLYNSSLLSHCSACFSLLSPPSHQFPPLLPTFPSNPHHVPKPPILYCSPQCSTSDSYLHLSSAEHHLLLSDHGDDTSDLRAALRLLRRLGQNEGLERIGGLMSNREKLMSRTREEEEEGYGVDVFARIRDGAKAMAVARRLRDGLDLDFYGDCVVEEAVLCAVLTNAVEVQVNGERPVGIAVYNTDFSWIDHSCSPNACYRFLPPEEARFSGDSPMLITPAATDGGCKIQVTHKVECSEYGPRIVVRSIRMIKKGEEVSIAYTDLLLPKGMRQSELWINYKFICCCRRCSEQSPTYPDHALQEIFIVNLGNTNLTSDQNFYRDKAVKKLNNHIDDAMNDYLSFSNPESCCAKLENILTHGILDEQSEEKEEKLKIFRLHPLNHMTLNAYTVLASAYKAQSSDLAAPTPVKNEHQLKAFGFSLTSAAYSLLLASSTHHLFLFDSSLIVSISNFWRSAGESLLCLFRSSVWNSFLERGLTLSFHNYRCCNCTLMDKFEANFDFSHARNAELEDISRQFLDCIKTITPKAWSFLVHKSCYLRFIKDPFDFGWLGTMESFEASDSKARLVCSDTEISFSKHEAGGCANQERISILELGVHCLLYGGFLWSICCGQQSYLTPCIKKFLYSEDSPDDNFAHRIN